MRLRDVGVPHEDIGPMVAIVHGMMEDARIVGRPIGLEELESLLQKSF
jgi:hypothetical protein